MTGINCIVFYSTFIFSKSDIKGHVASVYISGVNMVTAVIAFWLLKYFGRRTLLIYMLGFSAIFLALEGYFTSLDLNVNSWADNADLAVCLLFISAFEFGPGPIAWIYMSEVMNEKGVAMGTFLNWLFTLIFAVCSPYLMNEFPSASFYGFGCCCAISCIFTIVFVRETKGLNFT